MKIIKFDNCFDCYLTSQERKGINCPLPYENNEVERFPTDKIHGNCPLEDHKRCDCEPFHSCQKCSESTYQKAIEDINNVIAQVSCQHRTSFDKDLAIRHDEALKEIYLITHRDFKQPKSPWLSLSEMKVGVKYWIIDRDNITGFGHKKNNLVIEYDSVPDNFGKAVMCAEIRPPQVPGS